MTDYFDTALKQLLKVADNQERHWAELPVMLEKHAANTTIKVGAAAQSAVAAGQAELLERFTRLEKETDERHAVLLRLAETVEELTPKVMRNERAIKDLRRDLRIIEGRILALETSRA